MKNIYLTVIILSVVSCQAIRNRELIYAEKDNIITFKFIDDTLCKIYKINSPAIGDTLVYNCQFLEKEQLETIGYNQPPTDFKSKTAKNSFMQKITLNLNKAISNKVFAPFKIQDTLIYLKIKNKEYLYFDGGKKKIIIN